MVTIIRDRIEDLIKQGRTLEQVRPRSPRWITTADMARRARLSRAPIAT